MNAPQCDRSNTQTGQRHRSVVRSTEEKAGLRLLARLSSILIAGSVLGSAVAEGQSIYVLTSDGKLASTPLARPGAISAGVTINGVTAGETLVGIDVRPQNQQLYALGVNATANTATFYHLSPETGFAAVVGTASSIAFTTDGATPVDFPDPATVTWDIDFNPAADRLRVVAGSLTFRANPNTGGPVDGDNGGAAGSVTGMNPDGPINGGTVVVGAAGYTNNFANNGNVTTLYTLDGVTNSLFIQNPPNSGTQTLGVSITLSGPQLDFEPFGFDIAPGVNAPAANAAVTTGSGIGLLQVGGVKSLYSINLVTGAATALGGNIANAVSMAIRTEAGAAIGLAAGGTQLIRFNTATPGTTTTQAIGAITAGEVLVGIDMRPQTGQLMGLGVNKDTDTATLYLIDPQNGGVTVVGAASGIAFDDGAGNAVQLPDPATTGYGVDFNPTVDRVRVVTSSGLNFRVNPNTGAPVDGNLGGVTAVPNTNTDGSINGGGSTGVSGTAYTNSFARNLSVVGTTTQYTLDAASNTLFIQNPPNVGTQTVALPVTLGGSPLDFTDVNGFDIPAGVAVGTSNTPAVGEGWFVATVGGVTGLYGVDLATGAATSKGNVGAGATGLTGFIVNTTPALTVEAPVGTVLADAVDNVEFGSAVLAQAVTQTVTLRNAGSQVLTYSTSLDAGTAYAITGGGSGSIPGGGTTTITVAFTPQATGSILDVLRIANNDATVPSFDISLTGQGYVALANDAATTTTGSTRIYVLANDGLDNSVTITSVSDGAVSFDGRTVTVSDGYTGTFTYFTSNGGRGIVTVTAGTPTPNPTSFAGVISDFDDALIGSAKVTISANDVATVQLIGGTLKVNAKVVFPTGQTTASTFTPLGYLTLTKNSDGTIELSLSALGGNVGGTLQALVTSATATKFHIALRSIDSAFPGGGYAIATVSKKGAVSVVGLLPDGVPFSAGSSLRDNGTVAIYGVVNKAKPPAIVAGELVTANLAETDVTGEISWLKLPQLANVKGLHLGGVDTLLTANGSIFDGTVALPAGSGTLKLSGGNLAGDETATVTVTAGVPALSGSLQAWTGVKPKVGKFAAKVAVPNVTKPVKGSGLYLPKSNSAWGFFPGSSVGGRIELSVPQI